MDKLVTTYVVTKLVTIEHTADFPEQSLRDIAADTPFDRCSSGTYEGVEGWFRARTQREPLSVVKVEALV